MAEHNILGIKGEEIALNVIKKLGHKVIATNWRKYKHEIDIISKDKDILVITEVKTRSTTIFGNPEDAITTKKQQQLIEGANIYLEENEIDLECRFDVISIILNDKVTEIRHIKDAFYPESF